ncbi:MAG: TIGR02597 family protein, partial [Limisphaerales bacterium]
MKNIIVVFLAFTLECNAAVLFTQPPTGSGSLYQSSVNGTDYDQLTWDVFKPTNSAAITQIQWRGGYIYNAIYSGHVTNWTIAFYRDVGTAYQPDVINPPYEIYTISGNANETLVGTISGTTMYDYSVSLPSPFQAGAGTNFWLLIRADEPNIPDWGIAMGSGTHGSCFRRTAGMADWWFYRASGDIAFTLLTTDGPTVAIAVTASPAGTGEIIGAGSYPVNSLATLTAVPASNYGFVNWTQNGAQVSSSATYQFTATTNRTLVANFTTRYSLSVSASPNYGGTVTGGGTFNSNSVVNVIAVASPGYSFVNWTEFGTEVSTSDTYSFNVSGNRTLVANFAAAPATSTFDFDSGMPPVFPGQGMPSSQWNNGITASFSTLTGGWSIQNTFYYWVPGVFAGNFLYPSTWGSTLAISFDQPITNVSLAFFTGDVSSEYDFPTKIRLTAYTNSAMTNPVASATGQGDWLTGAYPEGTMSLHSTNPFTKIKVDMPPSQGTVSYIYWLDNIIVQAVPLPPAAINATVSPAGAGTITGAGTYANGATVLLSATANVGYAFSNWTENATEVWASSDYSFAASSNRTLVANFVVAPPTFDVALAAGPSNGGNVTGGGVFTNGENIIVSAVPAPGFSFVNWTENGVEVSTTPDYTFAVTTNRLLLANFIGNPPCFASVQSFNVSTDMVVTMTLNIDAGLTTSFEYKDSLLDPQWISLVKATTTGAPLILSDTPTNAQRFYRLEGAWLGQGPIPCVVTPAFGFVALNLLGDSDSIVSMPFVRPSVASGSAVSVNAKELTVATTDGSLWAANQFVYSAGVQSNSYYVRFTSGALNGLEFPIVANGSNTVTLDIAIGTLASVAAGDLVSIEPYWTLATIFPNGAGVNVSPTVGNRNSEILMPDLSSAGINLSATRVYFFNGGIWKQVGQGNADHSDDIIVPHAPFIVRHNVATNTTLIAAGAVVSDALAVPLTVALNTPQQDNWLSVTRP